MRALVLLAVIVLALSPVLPHADASGAVAVFLEVQDRGVNRVNDTVNITAHVFERGVPLGPTSAAVVAGTTPVAVTETSPGRLTGRYTIRGSDVVDGILRITATVTYGSESVTDLDLLAVSEDTSAGTLSLRLSLDDPADWTPGPGARIEFTAKVEYDGRLSDPDALGNFTLTYRTPPEVPASAPRILVPVHAALGVYAGAHVLNASLTVDHRLVISLEVAHLGESQHASLEVPVSLFQVWAHRPSIAGNEVAFDVCATGSDGAALEGALFALASPGPETAATDAEGRAHLSVLFNPGAAPLDIAGTISHGGNAQHFSLRWREILSGSEAFSPRPGALDLQWLGDFTSFRPGEQIQARYRVFNDTTPWGSRPVHYYGQGTDPGMTLAGPLLFAGGATTDASGEFSFSFRAPPQEGFVRVIVRAPTGTDAGSSDGLEYSEDVDLIPLVGAGALPPRDPEIVLTRPDLVLGSATEVSMETPLSVELSAVLTWEVPSTDWTRLTPPIAVHMGRQAAGFAGTVHLPACLGDATVRLVVTATEPATGRTWTNFLDVPPAPEPPEPGPDLSLPLALFTLVAATAVAVALVRRRSRPE